MDIRFLTLAAVLPLAACAGTGDGSPSDAGPPPPAAMTCSADAAQSYVGQTASPDLGGAILKATGARGVIVRGNGVQVIYGPHVTIIKNEVEEILS